MTVYSARCTAMKRAGIEDPTSKEGIRFCAGDRDSNGAKSQCPYDYCVVLEHKSSEATLRADDLRLLARELRAKNISVEDIALIIERSIVQTRKYLRK